MTAGVSMLFFVPLSLDAPLVAVFAVVSFAASLVAEEVHAVCLVAVSMLMAHALVRAFANRTSFWRLLLLALVILASVAVIMQLAWLGLARKSQNGGESEMLEACQWINVNTPNDAVIASTTRIQCLNRTLLPFGVDEAESRGATHVVTNFAVEDGFELEFATQNLFVFKVQEKVKKL